MSSVLLKDLFGIVYSSLSEMNTKKSCLVSYAFRTLSQPVRPDEDSAAASRPAAVKRVTPRRRTSDSARAWSPQGSPIRSARAQMYIGEAQELVPIECGDF